MERALTCDSETTGASSNCTPPQQKNQSPTQRTDLDLAKVEVAKRKVLIALTNFQLHSSHVPVRQLQQLPLVCDCHSSYLHLLLVPLHSLVPTETRNSGHSFCTVQSDNQKKFLPRSHSKRDPFHQKRHHQELSQLPSPPTRLTTARHYYLAKKLHRERSSVRVPASNFPPSFFIASCRPSCTTVLTHYERRRSRGFARGSHSRDRLFRRDR